VPKPNPGKPGDNKNETGKMKTFHLINHHPTPQHMPMSMCC